jgi:acid phosphatase (class B)
LFIVHAKSASPGTRFFSSQLNPGTNVAKLAEQAPIHWVSVAQIENSLTGRPPMAVGFDIDDTVLFSSPGFWRGKNVFSGQ